MAGHVARIGETSNAYNILDGKLEGKRHVTGGTRRIFIHSFIHRRL
jgi:hypothetical protein